MKLTKEFCFEFSKWGADVVCFIEFEFLACASPSANVLWLYWKVPLGPPISMPVLPTVLTIYSSKFREVPNGLFFKEKVNL